MHRRQRRKPSAASSQWPCEDMTSLTAIRRKVGLFEELLLPRFYLNQSNILPMLWSMRTSREKHACRLHPSLPPPVAKRPPAGLGCARDLKHEGDAVPR